jgi:hypothetical protein
MQQAQKRLAVAAVEGGVVSLDELQGRFAVHGLRFRSVGD